MNFFRLIADLLHLLSFILLFMKMKRNGSVIGVSYRTQEIYLVVFLMRYYDLFLYWVSLYNFLMKILFIGCTAYTIYLMRIKTPYSLTYDSLGDDFNHYKFCYPVAAVLTLFIHTELKGFELSWSYSIWLEAIAILPQLHMLQKIKEVENITGNYVASLGLYRFFYILNWIYRYFAESFICWTSTLGAVVQTVLYADFLYYYYIRYAKQYSFSSRSLEWLQNWESNKPSCLIEKLRKSFEKTV